MKIGVVRETLPGEDRVALVPDSVAALAKLGAEVLVEQGAGQAAGFRDEQYQAKGARLLSTRTEIFAEADIIVQVRTLGANLEAGITDLGLIRQGQLVIGMCEPLTSIAAMQQLAARGASVLAMELIPRISR